MHFHGQSSVHRPLVVEHLEERRLLTAQSLQEIITSEVVELPVAASWLATNSAQWDRQIASQVDYVHNDLGLTGQGQTVAVIDTGIAYDHVALGGGFGSSYRVVGGRDFAESDHDPYDDGPAGYHGTHVAGIIGSDHEVYTGVAPGVDLVALRVFDDRGSGEFASIESALRWVHQHRDDFEHPITTVNMSLGSTWNADRVPGWGRLEDELAQLKLDGIFVAVAAGNSYRDYDTEGLSYPAVSPHVVPVASMGASGNMSAFSQRNERVIVAPGESITSTVPDYLYDFNGVTDDFLSASGTSMAAPFVAGASVLLREAWQLIGITDVDQQALLAHLRRTADLVSDPLTATHYTAINLQQALLSALPADEFGDLPQDAHDLGALENRLEITGIINAVGDQDCFRFTAPSSGIVRVASQATGQLEAVWDVPGAAAATTAHAEFEVVSGHTYVVGLGTAAGIGTYHAEFSLDIGAHDLGVVDATTIDPSLGGSRAYTFTAAHSGWLTITAHSDVAAGNCTMQLIDSRGSEMARTDVDSGQTRLMVDVVAGRQYELRMSDGSMPEQISVTNLVAQEGRQTRLFATANADRLIVRATPGRTIVTAHGESYDLGPGGSVDVQIIGGDAQDEVLVYGSQRDESADVYRSSAHLDRPGYHLHVAGLERIALIGGGGQDQLTFHDTAGSDQFIATPAFSIFSSSDGMRHVGRDFDSVRALSHAGQDTAVLYDAAGDDTLSLTPHTAHIAYHHASARADGFDLVYALANRGGADTVHVSDSTADDRFVFRPEFLVVTTPDAYQFVKGFESVTAVAERGGSDELIAFDSFLNDQLRVFPELIELNAASQTLVAQGFESTAVIASRGGFDTARFGDSAQHELFVSHGNYSLFSSDEFRHVARGFDEITAVSSQGGFDAARLYAAESGQDVLHQTDQQTSMIGADSTTHVWGFADVSVVGQTGQGGGDNDGGGRNGGGPGTSTLTAQRTIVAWLPVAQSTATATHVRTLDDGRAEPAHETLPVAAATDSDAIDQFQRQDRSPFETDRPAVPSVLCEENVATELACVDAIFGNLGR